MGTTQINAIAIVLGGLLLVSTVQAEEMIRPRGQAAYEAELRALNAKYGPQGAVNELREQSEGAAPVATASAAEQTDLASNAQKQVGEAPAVRVSLLPVGERQFLFAEQVYDGAALELQLAQMEIKQPVDSILLLSNAKHKIEISHLLELSRLGRALNLPALYQDGDAIKAIAGR